MDRRVQRTRSSLIQALPRLMMQYDWDTINVQLLCDHADISRSAFYTHFKNKAEVLEQCFEHLEQELLGPVSARGLDKYGTLMFVPNLLNHVQSHSELLRRNTSSTAGLVILNRFKTLVKQMATCEFNQSKRYKLHQGQITFITGGIFALLEQWNDEQCQNSIKGLTKQMDKMVSHFLPD